MKFKRLFRLSTARFYKDDKINETRDAIQRVFNKGEEESSGEATF